MCEFNQIIYDFQIDFCTVNATIGHILGMRAVIPKPFTWKDIIHVINTARVSLQQIIKVLFKKKNHYFYLKSKTAVPYYQKLIQIYKMYMLWMDEKEDKQEMYIMYRL